MRASNKTEDAMTVSPFHTPICDLLGIRHPILQGAMQGAGGPRLVAAVSEAGGLGILPTFGGTEEALRADIEATRNLTGKPFAVNITPMGKAFTESRARICIEMNIPIVTTGRADPGEGAVHMMKQAGIVVLSVIPSVEHALRMQEEGVDAVIASGREAGGHVGHIATLPLVPLVADAVDIPVLAAGGIADGRGFLAAFALGAVGVQIGTRFIVTPESNAGAWYRRRIIDMNENQTIVSDVLTGATVRCIATPEVMAYEKARLRGADATEMRELRHAARQNYGHSDKIDPELRRQGTVGQIAGMIHEELPAAQIIDTIIADAARLAGNLADLAAAQPATAAAQR
jgi:enoyl-[acyl-carrier protein] reductase II